jgi:hypothetical protein
VDPAHIRLRRERARWTDRLRDYKVVIDGVVAGKIGHDTDQVFDLAPGTHEVQLRIDRASSQPIEVRLGPGEQARLTCRGRNPLAAGYWAAFGRSRYVVLERESEA